MALFAPIYSSRKGSIRVGLGLQEKNDVRKDVAMVILQLSPSPAFAACVSVLKHKGRNDVSCSL